MVENACSPNPDLKDLQSRESVLEHAEDLISERDLTFLPTKDSAPRGIPRTVRRAAFAASLL